MFSSVRYMIGLHNAQIESKSDLKALKKEEDL